MRRRKRDVYIDANDPTTFGYCFSIEREKATPEHHAFVRSIQQQISEFISRLEPRPSDSRTPGDDRAA